MRARRRNLLRCTADRRSNQRLAIAPPRAGGVRSDRAKKMERGRMPKHATRTCCVPLNLESWRAIARVASRTGQWASALEWWKKVDDAHRLTVEDRRDYIGAALVSGEIRVAAKQVEALLAQPAGPAPIDIVWAGQVAARQSDPVLALDYAERALADKRAKPYDILSAATLDSLGHEPLFAAIRQRVAAN